MGVWHGYLQCSHGNHGSSDLDLNQPITDCVVALIGLFAQRFLARDWSMVNITVR